MRRSFGLLVVAGVALVACKDRQREASTNDFASLYARLRIASSSMEGQPEKAREAREHVLRSSGTDLVRYRKSLLELQADPERWEAFWVRVQFLADSLENKPTKKGI